MKPFDSPDENTSPSTLMSSVALGQAAFYLATGIWPLLSMNTFEKVTGPKTDKWLVKTVAMMINVVGVVLAVAGSRRKIAPEIPLLAVGSALALTAVDVVYVSKKRISKIYLLDAVTELILVALWIVAWQQARTERA
jgi:hypothetical protein